MDDVALDKRRPVRRETGPAVKCLGVHLRVERSTRIPARSRIVEQGVEHTPTDARAAARGHDRHATDLHGLLVLAVVPARGDHVAVADQHMPSRHVVAVVLVELFIRRHVLLVDENAEAEGKRFGDAFAVRTIEDFEIHRLASDSRLLGELRVMIRLHLCTGLLERDGRVLVVGNQYPNHAALLWNLPGGRQEWGETAPMTVERELREETGLAVRANELLYVAESFDHVARTHVTAFCFAIVADGEPAVPSADAHVRACRFVAYEELPALLTVRVIREPLLGYLDGRRRRYFGYLDAGITIAFADAPAALAATPPGAADTGRRPHDVPE